MHKRWVTFAPLFIIIFSFIYIYIYLGLHQISGVSLLFEDILIFCSCSENTHLNFSKEEMEKNHLARQF